MAKREPRVGRRAARLVSVDARSFEEFYEREYRSVLAFARVLTGDRTRAEDVAHDAFAAALVSWGDFENPAGWIRTVVANKANSAWRRRYAEQRAVGRLGSEVRIGQDVPAETEEFWGAVRRLPAGRRRRLHCSIWRTDQLPRSPGSSDAENRRLGFI